MSRTNVTIVRWIGACIAIAIGLAASSVQAWQSAHGGRDNSGLAGVVTAPAGKGSVSVPGLGKFAPGAGPVIAPDGTVYIGTIEGKLIALHADGSPFWSRDITPGQSIVASPVISSDGSIYVIGVKRVRKYGSDAPEDMTFVATLHHFNSTGAWLNQIAFPQHGGIGPAAFSPPNIWRDASGEAIMVPAVYPNKVTGGYAVRLIAFSLSGQVLDDKVVKNITPQSSGGSDFSWGEMLCLTPVIGWATCALAASDYNPRRIPNLLMRVPPAPGVAITFADNGTPFILASDHYKDLVGFVFSEQRLVEIFRLQETDFLMRTPPMVLPDRSTLIGVESLSRDNNNTEEPNGRGRIIVAERNGQKVGQVALNVTTQAAPTRMADGRVALVDGSGTVVILKDGAISGSMQGAGLSIASAAASLSHIFVAGEDGFITFDTNSLAQVARFDWVGGGLNPPVIGPKGHVYAIASNILFVFPPPKLVGSTISQPQGGMMIATPQPTTPQEKEYKPPMTAGGNRLFACEELDQDDCGKGDYRSIAKAFCVKNGFADADDIDVDNKKVKAETLDGQYCTKKKCKVFDQIVCKM